MLLKLGLGAAFWGIMFLAVSAVMITPLPLVAQQVIEIIVAAGAGFILGKIYFKKNPGDLKQGVMTAVIWLLIGTVLDLLITIQYVKADGTYVDGLKTFYGTWSLWVSFVLFIAAVASAAKLTHGGALVSARHASQLAGDAGGKPPASEASTSLFSRKPAAPQPPQPSQPTQPPAPQPSQPNQPSPPQPPAI